MTKEDKTLYELFLELAKPDKNGKSRIVSAEEFKGEYSCLVHTNGWSWGRKGSRLHRDFIIEKKRRGPKATYQLCGFNKGPAFSQYIPIKVREYYKDSPCAFTGITSNIEIDHKDGYKDPEKLSGKDLTKKDFQPLTKSVNDWKRQKCKECKNTGKRFNAKNIPYIKVSYLEGDETYNKDLGCRGCFLYDFRVNEFVLGGLNESLKSV